MVTSHAANCRSGRSNSPVAQLLDIFAFVSVLLRGMTLAFEALTIGGVIFMLAIVRKTTSRGLSRFLILFSTLLAVTQILFVAANSAILMNSAELTWEDVRGAGYCVAGAMIVAGAVVIAGFARSLWSKLSAWPAGCLLILCGTAMTSHAAARLEHRSELAFLTLVHHAAGAAWIGGLPYLIWALRENPNRETAQCITSRFSRLAMTAVPTLFVAGAAMGFLYVGNRSALTGTTYGIMLSSKAWHADNPDCLAGRTEFENRSSDPGWGLSKPDSPAPVCQKRKLESASP